MMLIKWIVLSFIILTSLLLISSKSYAETALLQKKSINLGTFFKVYIDENKSQSLQSILLPKNQKKFVNSTVQSPNFGFTNKGYWLSSQIQSKYSTDILLEIANPKLDSIHVYLYDDKQLIRHFKSGDQYPFSQRLIKHQHFIFPLPLLKNKTYRLLLYVDSRDGLFMPVFLWDKDSFYNNESTILLSFGIFYGVMGFMVLINLLMYLSLKETDYLKLALFIATFSLAMIILGGQANRFFWGEYPWWGKHSLTFFEGISSLFVLMFTRSFLMTAKYTPRLDKILLILSIVSIITIVLALFVDYRWSLYIMSIQGLIIPLFTLIAGFLCWQHQYRPARYFLFALGGFMIAVTVYALMAFTLLPYNIVTNFFMHVSMLWMSLMLSLALTDRFILLKEQTEKAQFDIIKEQKSMVKSISRFVPTQFINLLNKTDIRDVKYGDATLKNMFVLFSDIRNFSSLSEKMTPKESFQFLNLYMSFMEPSVEKNKGFVDKFIGDAIMALFPEKASHAIQSAIEMHQKLHLFNQQLNFNHEEPLKIGIGIHGGDLMLGTIGSDTRLETTVIGDTVNLTARLEELTKELNIAIIISEFVYQAIENPNLFSIRMIDNAFQARGKIRSISLYEVFDYNKADIFNKKQKTAKFLTKALTHLKQQQYGLALIQLHYSQQVYPEDKVTSSLILRCTKALKAIE